MLARTALNQVGGGGGGEGGGYPRFQVMGIMEGFFLV